MRTQRPERPQGGGGIARAHLAGGAAGFVCSADGFTDQPKVINGASDLFGAVLGDRGSHARLAIGVKELPLESAVEVEVIAEVGGEGSV